MKQTPRFYGESDFDSNIETSAHHRQDHFETSTEGCALPEQSETPGLVPFEFISSKVKNIPKKLTGSNQIPSVNEIIFDFDNSFNLTGSDATQYGEEGEELPIFGAAMFFEEKNHPLPSHHLSETYVKTSHPIQELNEESNENSSGDETEREVKANSENDSFNPCQNMAELIIEGDSAILPDAEIASDHQHPDFSTNITSGILELQSCTEDDELTSEEDDEYHRAHSEDGDEVPVLPEHEQFSLGGTLPMGMYGGGDLNSGIAFTDQMQLPDGFAFPDGGWVCSKCQNYNFAGRSKCNRCKKSKSREDYEGKPQHLLRRSTVSNSMSINGSLTGQNGNVDQFYKKRGSTSKVDLYYKKQSPALISSASLISRRSSLGVGGTQEIKFQGGQKTEGIIPRESAVRPSSDIPASAGLLGGGLSQNAVLGSRSRAPMGRLPLSFLHGKQQALQRQQQQQQQHQQQIRSHLTEQQNSSLISDGLVDGAMLKKSNPTLGGSTTSGNIGGGNGIICTSSVLQGQPRFHSSSSASSSFAAVNASHPSGYQQYPNTPRLNTGGHVGGNGIGAVPGRYNPQFMATATAGMNTGNGIIDPMMTLNSSSTSAATANIGNLNQMAVGMPNMNLGMNSTFLPGHGGLSAGMPPLQIQQGKKKIIERSGDWFCKSCHNLNFAFRKECNRCHLSKDFQLTTPGQL